MTPKEVRKLIGCTQVWRKNRECHEAFYGEAQYVQYGSDELQQAFAWFVLGWHSRDYIPTYDI